MNAGANDQSLSTMRADVAVVGGGLVGLSLAAALGSAGVSTIVVERQDPAAMDDARYDGRTTAIAQGSKRALQAVGAWEKLERHASPILEIRVSDGRVDGYTSPLFLHYDHAEVGDEPLGYIAENRMIRRVLMNRLRQAGSVRIIAPATVHHLKHGHEAATLSLDNGMTVRAQLVAACDGRASPVRDMAGIKVTEHRYKQTALVCTVAHEKPHGGIAHERFLPGGPFAILPMTDDSTAKPAHRSSIVWTEEAEAATRIAALDDGAFMRELALRFGDFLGKVSLAGPRFTHPLAVHLAHSYGTGRVVLVGDAAHGIHPIAGQGLNLGWQDIAALAQEIVDQRRLGLDVGQPALLRAYQAQRRADNLMMAATTDALNRLFSNDIPVLRQGRDIGLATVNRIPTVKRILMRHAMGTLGEKPRLIRGERL